MNKCKVSIIVPVYNVEKYLAECLDSILNQTLQDIEIICVNDAATDNSAQILERYEQRDSRIKVITHEKNGGLGAARNTGVSYANAPYIAFVDSDDTIEPTFVETLYRAISDNNADMSWCSSNTIDELSNFLSSDPIPEKNRNVLDLLNCESLYPSILPVWNKLFKRDYLVEIKQLPIVSEDQPALAEYFIKCNNVITVNESLYNYRFNTNTLSRPKSPKPELWNDFFYSHELFFKILKQKYPSNNDLRKQAVLRYFSLLWRIKTFNILNQSNWIEHQKNIRFHILQDKINLRKYSPLFYNYLKLVFSGYTNRKSKKVLIDIGITLSKNKWVKRDSFIYLPFDLIRVFKPYVLKYFNSLLDNFEIKFIRIIVRIVRFLYTKPVWIIGERPSTAQDNGYSFFKYLVEHQKNIKAYYIIDKKSKQYNYVKKLGNTVQYDSIKHKYLFIICTHYVTSHDNFCFPRTIFGKKKYTKHQNTTNTFLQHGITYSDNSDDYGKENSQIDLFICGAKPEFDFVMQRFGYNSTQVRFTGFARFDSLHNNLAKNQILLMPTWRKNIWKNRLANNEGFFLNSKYYKTLQALIQNDRLNYILEVHNYKLVFYPHYEIQPYLNQFSTTSKNIVIASMDRYNVQDLLKESALLITDSSSVNFDFAYMYKPVIYYFFDRDDFVKNHLKPGYFDHRLHGFGEVIETEAELIHQIEIALENGCVMPQKYKNRVTDFFPLHDSNNCQRIFEAIVNFNKNY